MAELTNKYFEALRKMHSYHHDKLRKGTAIPYISHLMSVSALVMEMGGTEDQAIAALLYDALEDQPKRASDIDIEVHFGKNVLKMVKECSDCETHPKPPWKERKEAYIDHIEEISQDALMISIADKLHNLRTLVADYKQFGDWVFTKFKGKKEGTLWYYNTLVDKYKIILSKYNFGNDQDHIFAEEEYNQRQLILNMQAAVEEMVGLLDWFNL
jgi:(p)ppGpp synthase/HD superfamily hydrolase